MSNVKVIIKAIACLDSVLQHNGTEIKTIPSAATFNLKTKLDNIFDDGVWDGIDTISFTSATGSPVTFQVNGVTEESITAGATFSLIATLDGVPDGIYNAGTNTLAFISGTCSPVTFQINGSTQETITAGATFSLIATLDGVPGGTYNSGTDTLAFTSSIPTPKTTAFVLKSGETFNYGTGTDGEVQSGRLSSWLVLEENNMFGNTNRFTDTLGGSTYSNNIVLDHSTRSPLTGNLLGYDRADVITARTFAAHLTYFASKTNSGYSNWRGTNYNELHQISRWGGVNFKWSNAPFSYTGVGTGDYLWCGTTNNFVTADAWLVFNYSTVPVQSRDKTGSYFMMGCRTFNLTSSGVLT